MLHDLWPALKGVRNYKTEQINRLSPEEWRELLRLVRNRLGRSVVGEPATKRNRNRAFRKLKRLLRRKRGVACGGPVNVDRRAMAWQMRECSLLSNLCPNRDRRWVPPLRRKNEKRIDLGNFSLIENPSQTMVMLHEIAEGEATARSMTINFLDLGCVDVSAYLVLGVMQQRMVPIATSGIVSNAVLSMLDAVGLNRFLGWRHASTKPDDPAFFPFTLRHRRGKGTSRAVDVAFQPSSVEKLSDQLTGTINQWLGLLRRAPLSNEQMGQISRMVSEPLDNAERHSDLVTGDGDWAIAGFFSPTRFTYNGTGEQHIGYVVSLAIVSLGASIAESLSKCEDTTTSANLGRYIEKHRSKNRSADLLTTVFALQDTVSRFRQDDDRSKGGIGLMDMIEFVNDIGETDIPHEQPSLTLISGRNCITLKNAYRRAPPVNGRGAPRTLWFNPENTSNISPDTEYAFDLPYNFPGTIVAIRFCIKPEARPAT